MVWWLEFVIENDGVCPYCGANLEVEDPNISDEGYLIFLAYHKNAVCLGRW